MSLLRKASIVTTPTSYENGKILSVKPSIVLGSELVVNGDFSDGTNDWSVANGTISIDNDRLKIDGNSGATAEQTVTAIIGKTYKVTYNFTLGTATSGALIITGGNYPTLNAPQGVNTFYTTATQTNLRIRPRLGSTGTMFIDNVSVKEAIDADFDFTRNSSATRTNSQGLIEDMQILSGDLVTNGDFSQEGSEEVTNGDFSVSGTPDATSWALGWSSNTNNAEIANGKLTLSNSATESVSRAYATNGVNSNNILTTNKFYKLQYDIVENNGATDLKYYSANAEFISVPSVDVGSYTLYIQNTGNSLFLFQLNTSNASISLDNVSVKEVGQDWTLGTGWSIGDGKATSDASVSSYLNQTLYTIGNLYKLKFEVLEGTIELRSAQYSKGTGYYTTGIHEIEVIPTTTSTHFYVYTGFGQSSITNISVIEITDDTNLPRIDYTGGEGHWLFEPQSTNLIPYSEDFSQWGLSNTTVSANSLISPNGTQNASKIVENNSNSNFQFFKNASVTNGTTYTISIFAKSSERYLQLKASTGFTSSYANFDLINGTLGTNGGNLTPRITDYGNDWYKCSVTYEATSTTNALFVWHIVNSSSASRGQTYQGDGLSGVFVWGAQVEASSFATSYIPTNGSTVTRLKDAAFGSGNSDLINSTEGVLYFEGSALTNETDVNKTIGISNVSSSNRVQLTLHGTPSRISFYGTSSEGFALSYSNFSYNKTEPLKIAVKWKIGDVGIFINGIKVYTGTPANTFLSNTLNTLSFADYNNIGSPFYGKTKCVAVFKEALTDEELECLTTI